jgi:hypothetical protein
MLECYGFRLIHESTAVAVYDHPDHPGLIVRIGTTQVIAERDADECFRSSIADFDLNEMVRTLGLRANDC